MIDLLPSAEQRDIVDAVSDPIVEILPLARLHAAPDEGRGWLGQLAELGVLAIALGEDAGGAGLSVVEEALLFERLGRQLASPAILASVIAAHIAADYDQPLAQAIGAGQRSVALAIPSGTAVLLLDPGASPDLVLLIGPDGPVLHDAAPASRGILDSSQWALPLESATLAGVGKLAAPAIAARAKLLIAAQLAGIAAAARDMGVDYAKLREQFGRPIGSFQAVKHHCADMAAAAMAAADLLAFAAVAQAQGRDDDGFQAEAALAVAIRAAVANAAANIQIHGGIGFSDEADPHLFVKHAHIWEAVSGGVEAVRAALLGESFPLQPAAPRRH